MKKRLLLTGPEAREKVIRGAQYAADAVKLTLGPHGRNFASGIVGGPVRISNDGVSLLKEIEGRDEFEDLGVRAVRESSTKTNDEAGDGTTSAAVLTAAILKELNLGDKDIIGSRRSAVEMTRQIKEECAFVIRELEAMATPVDTKEDLIAATRVSVEDPLLADLIGEAYWTVGKHGTVLVEEASSKDDSVEYVHGIRVDNGYTTSRIINNQERQSLELEACHVILTNDIFHGNLKKIDHILQQLLQKGAHNVVIMARGFDDGAIGVCVKNIQEGALKIFPINAPYVMQDDVMEDLAAVLGGKYIKVPERNLETMQVGDIGYAQKILARRFEGIITGKKSGEDAHVDNRVKERIEHLEEKLKGELSPFERRLIEGRLSQLIAGTATIKVGAETEQMRRYRKDKVDDAVNSARAAFLEGVVPGAGLALVAIADRMPNDALLKKPLRAVYEQVMALSPEGFQIEEWVKDPVKVIRVSLTKAVEIASSLATTEIVVNWEREKPQYVTSVDNKIGQHDEE